MTLPPEWNGRALKCKDPEWCEYEHIDFPCEHCIDTTKKRSRWPLFRNDNQSSVSNQYTQNGFWFGIGVGFLVSVCIIIWLVLKLTGV